jgi:hypothetical protein
MYFLNITKTARFVIDKYRHTVSSMVIPTNKIMYIYHNKDETNIVLDNNIEITVPLSSMSYEDVVLSMKTQEELKFCMTYQKQKNLIK